MSSLASTVLSLLALVLAVTAIILATIANRRWARRPRSRDGAPPRPALIEAEATTAPASASPLAALGGQLAELESQVAVLRAMHDARSDDDQRDQEVSRLASALARVDTLLAATRADVDALQATAPRDPTALRHVALVRYDAFADVGGRLSYSVALLDDTRSGLVLTTLAGKAEVRTYVRTVSGGTGDAALTAEEQQAVAAAMASGAQDRPADQPAPLPSSAPHAASSSAPPSGTGSRP